MSRFPMSDAGFLSALAEVQGRGSLEDYPAYLEETHLRTIAAVLSSQPPSGDDLVAVSTLDLLALRDVESEIENGDDVDPRVYVCTWQTQFHQNALISSPWERTLSRSWGHPQNTTVRTADGLSLLQT